MSIFQNIREWISSKQSEAQERRDFLKLVEEETKPIKRAAYLEEMKKIAIDQGKDKAKEDYEKTKPKKKTAEDFGLGDPYKFINK